METTADAFVFHVGNRELRFSGRDEDFEVTVVQPCARVNFLAEHLSKVLKYLRFGTMNDVYVLVDDDAPLKVSAVARGAVFSIFVARSGE